MIHDSSEYPQPDGRGCAACNGCTIEFFERQYGKENLFSESSEHWEKIFGEPGLALYHKDKGLLVDVANPKHSCRDA